MPKTTGAHVVPFSATILTAAPGKRLAKRYRDPDQRPDDYDAGHLFRAEERTFSTFAAFVAALSRIRPDQCLIRGAVRAEAREDVEAGLEVRRLEHDRPECPAAFEPAARNWIVLDFDDTDSPFLPDAIGESVEFWRESLPPELREAQAAFFPSANAHRSDTIRGKLLVALDSPIDNATAEAYAKSVGADPSVCRTVQPNYFAAPVFEGCRDPLEGQRHAWMLRGVPVKIPAGAAENATSPAPKARTQSARDATPRDVPEPTPRVLELALTLYDRWLEGGRVEGNAWLHLAGWLLGKDWSKGEVASLLVELDAAEPDAGKRREHWHILGNAVAIDGLGGAREWLGEDLAAVDKLVNHDPTVAAILERRRQSPANDTDPWEVDTDWTGEDTPIDYVCEGLRLAPSKGKISILAGDAGGGKGPIVDHLAVCFALGLKAFNEHQCVQSKVLLIDEEGARLTKRRVMRMTRAMGRDPAELKGRLFHIDASTVGPLMAEANLDAIKRRIERDGISIVLLDSYTTAMLGAGIEQNSPDYAVLAQELSKLGVTVIAVAHDNKSRTRANSPPQLGDIAGTGALGALAQTAIMVHYPDPEDRFRVAVTCARAPETPFKAFEVRFSDTSTGDLDVRVAEPPPEHSSAEGENAETVRKIGARVAAVAGDADALENAVREIDTMSTGVSPKKLRDVLGLSSRAYAAAVRECQRRKSIVLVSLPSEKEACLRTAGAPRQPPH